MDYEKTTNGMSEPKLARDMSDSNGRIFKKEPAINVIGKEAFEERIEKVFKLLGDTLAKSFGPFGAPTMIYQYPYRHVTKDGFTIFKSISFDASETLLDQCIADLAGDICGRINFAVGDGTTTAVIATNNIYQNYIKIRDELASEMILPRDIQKYYEHIKEVILEKLKAKAVQIDKTNPEALRKAISDIVYISSNGDDIYTQYISELYAELGGPMITCRLAADGKTKKYVVEGYKFDLQLNDRIYINNDNNTMRLKDADIIIFGTTIDEEIYKRIIEPLNLTSKIRNRKLIVAAPRYDETVMRQIIAPALNSEHAREKDINLVLTTYRNFNSYHQRLSEDFAMMMHTTIIDKTLLRMIYDKLAARKNIEEIFNVDTREFVPGLSCLCRRNGANENEIPYSIYDKSKEAALLEDGLYTTVCSKLNMIEQPIDLGYVKDCTLCTRLGIQSSYFTDLCYDESVYQSVLAEARASLEEVEEKYKKLATFNLEVSQAQERVYMLQLKMGVIEVGGDTELAQKLTKDAIDDAVKAAASAYRNGFVLGCNINLIQVIYNLFSEAIDNDKKMEASLLSILLKGFIDVYKTVLRNAFENKAYVIDDNFKNVDVLLSDLNHLIHLRNPECDVVCEFGVKEDTNIINIKNAVAEAVALWGNEITLYDVLIMYSILESKSFDVTKFAYTSEVINSVQTDEEVFKATVDLISIMIVGNQMVVTQKHNFE